VRRALLALALVVLAGCGGAAGGGDKNDNATVFAAASLTEVFPQVDSAATYNFAGSDDLATQITEGAPADVFAAASTKYPDQLYDQGMVDKPEVFATNRLVLIVPKDNPTGIQSVDDLRNPDVKLETEGQMWPYKAPTSGPLATLTTGAEPWNIVISPNGTRAFVANSAQDTITVIRTDTRTIECSAPLNEVSLPNTSNAISVSFGASPRRERSAR